MVEMAITILKRMRDNVTCGICQNIITNPMRNMCGHRFCYYCICTNAKDPSDDICNCPRCNAAVNRNRLVQDVVFGNVVNKTAQLLDSIQGADLTDRPKVVKDLSPMGKRRLATEGYEDIDLDKSIEETEADAREMARDIGGNRGTKRPIEAVNEPVESVKRSFAIPKTSTPTGSGKERELSPFPVSFLNKFTLQSDKRASDKQPSPSPKRIREPLNRKLSFEGDERRETLMSDSSDSEDRRIRGVTYSRFDRVRQPVKKSNGAQTEIVYLEKKSQYQQTDGTNKSDLYSNLSNLFNCLCTQHGIHGSIIIDGIGRFEINLSKPSDHSSATHLVSASHLAVMADKRIQTEPIKKPIIQEIGVNTNNPPTTKESEMQTENIQEKETEKEKEKEEKEKRQERQEPIELDLTKDSQVLTIDEDRDEEMKDENEEPGPNINLNGATKQHLDKFGDIEVTHEVTSISQIVKEFSEDPINSQDYDDDVTRYDHIKASTRLSQAIGKINETDDDATEIVTQVVTQAAQEGNFGEESDIEDDPPQKEGDNESNIVLESDEDDKFLMSCVFDTLDDDDDELESGRSLSTSSRKTSGIKIDSTRNLDETNGSVTESRSHKKKRRA